MSEEKIYPLIFKPGVQKDGTNFQGDFCIDSQWVRWQMQKIRKIGGMLGAEFKFIFTKNVKSYCNIYMVPTLTNNISDVYISVCSRVFLCQIDTSNMLKQSELIELDTGAFQENYFVTFEKIIIATYNEDGSVALDQESLLLMLLTPNAVNINASGASYLYTKPLYSNNVETNNVSEIVQNGADGGMLYIAPYLFFYGSNGVVKYSKADRSKLFKTKSYTTITVGSGEKIIYAASWRGATSPTLILWTTSSVIRLLNVSDQNAIAPIFKPDVALNTSSIMSSRSVVQYNNIFEWVGTDGFYIYNGTVNDVQNDMIFNYFFDNLDFNRRQQVVAVLNKKFNEIWYFYPTKNNSYVNSSVLIHNIKDKCWYSSNISRSASYYYNFDGKMYSFGAPINDIPTPDSDYSQYFFKHDIETDEVINNRGSTPIESYFITPTFSFASFSPLKEFVGLNRFIRIKTLEPDFVYEEIDMKVEVLGRKYGMQIPTIKSTHQINNDIITKGKIDILTEARQMSLKFTTTKFFQFGNNFMLLSVGDGQ